MLLIALLENSATKQWQYHNYRQISNIFGGGEITDSSIILLIIIIIIIIIITLHGLIGFGFGLNKLEKRRV